MCEHFDLFCTIFQKNFTILLIKKTKVCFFNSDMCYVPQIYKIKRLFLASDTSTSARKTWEKGV
jgi:hypothetical protein